MDSILNAKLMSTFYEFRVFFEVRECVHDLVTQVEIEAKDSTM